MDSSFKGKECAYEYVQAISSYEYNYKGQLIAMAKGEIFLLLKQTSDDWWQVIRKGEKRPFYAPREYLELTHVEPSTMKSSLRKKMAHQRHLQNQKRQMEESQNRNSIDEDIENREMNQLVRQNHSYELTDQSLSLMTSIIAEDSDNNDSLEIDVSSHSDSQPKLSRKHESYLGRRPSESPSSFGSGDFSGCSMQSQSSSSKEVLSSSPSHTSVSSLTDEVNNKSDESFLYFALESSNVAKAASTDGLRMPTDFDVVSGIQEKAASNEELDIQRKKDLCFKSNLLSLRKRSNSVDMQECETNLSLIETDKHRSLDKKKSRLSKDPMNRRRSWAMNDAYCTVSFDMSRPLAVEKFSKENAPKLPPKIHRRINRLSFSTDNLKKISTPEDIKREDDVDTNGSRNHFQEPFTDRISTFEKKAPIALPRKTIPVITNKSLPKTHETTSASQTTEVQSIDRLKKHQHLANGKLISHKRASSLGPSLNSLSMDNANVGSDLLEPKYSIKQKTAELFDSEKWSSSCKFKEASEKVMALQKIVPGKGKRVEELIEELENKTKASKNCDVNRLVQQSPPSPTSSPILTLFDDWGKYLEKESGMLFYYNSGTKEKRWKPPRRSAPQPRTKVLLDRSVSPIPSSPNLSPKRATISKPNSDSLPMRNIMPKPKPPIVHMLSTNAYGRQRTDSYASPPTRPRNPCNYALDTSRSAHAIVSVVGEADKSASSSPNKSQWSLLSSISNSFSFMKSNASTHSISKSNISVPTNLMNTCERAPSLQQKDSGTCEKQLEMQTVLEKFETPRGWVRKYDALSQQIYFQNLLTGEKWNPATDCSANLYFYPANGGGDSKWSLPDYHAAIDSPPDSIRSEANADKDPTSVVKEEYVSWCMYCKEGKKVRKNWTSAYVKYMADGAKSDRGVAYGVLSFSKSPDEQKKMETFHMVPPCYLLQENGGTTSRDHSLAIKNAQGSIVLMQAKDVEAINAWKQLFKQKNVKEISHTPDKERKAKKVSDKTAIRRDSAEECVNNNNEKGLKDILLSFLKKRPMQETLVNKGIYKESVFGSTIGELCSKDATYIPLFVLKCINAIEKKPENFKVEGLYRIPGNAPRIQKIRFEIAQNRYSILEEEKDVHNLTGSLKLFFRELKEPLIPFRNYQSLIQSTGSEFLKGRTRWEALKGALKKLPRCNYDTLKILLEHLLKINMYEKVNRMSLMNLAIVFGPCLLWPESTAGFDLMTGVMLQNRVVEALLSDYKAIYKD